MGSQGVFRQAPPPSVGLGDDPDGCASSTFELGVDDKPQKFLHDVEISVCATGKNLNRTRLMNMAMARYDRRLRTMLNLWRQPGRCNTGGINGQGGNSGVALVDGSPATYYAITMPAPTLVSQIVTKGQLNLELVL